MEKFEGGPIKIGGPIDVQKNPYPYHADFIPDDPKNMRGWELIRPTHISEKDWPVKLAELKEQLKNAGEASEEEKSDIVHRWKTKNGLFPKMPKDLK